MTSATRSTKAKVFTGRVATNRVLCREHRRLTLAVPGLPAATPGQFVHIGPHVAGTDEQGQPQADSAAGAARAVPFLRRAFSIAGLDYGPDGPEIDLIYRVVGAGTGWLSGLADGDLVAGIGPLGNGFTFPPPGATAWLVAGGVGLPPLLWLARELQRSGHRAVFFLGARSRELIALDIATADGPTTAREMPDVPLVLATDDGSAGLQGTVVDAVEAHAKAHEPAPADVAVYTCGPQIMMRAVAGFCRARDIPCQACLERAMACGIGTCQSCVVPVTDPSDRQGWRYALCCTQGPVFDAAEVLWDR